MHISHANRWPLRSNKAPGHACKTTDLSVKVRPWEFGSSPAQIEEDVKGKPEALSS